MTYHLPPDGRIPSQILSSDRICNAAQQQHNQTPTNPMLSASLGDTLKLQWNENGHITKPYNNPPQKVETGAVFVYGTFSSSPEDSLLAIHNVWNTNGSGGDGRGVLLASSAFDDGKCYQYTDSSSGHSQIEAQRSASNPGPGNADPEQNQNLWCTVDVELPTSGVGSIYTLYWVWDWPTEIDGQLRTNTQIYTTCLDIRFVDIASV